MSDRATDIGNQGAHAISLDQAKTGGARGHLPVDAALLQFGMKRTFDLYDKVGRTMVLFCAADLELESRKLREKLAQRSSTLYAPVEQGQEVSRYAEAVLSRVVQDTRIEAERRCGILHSSALTIMSDVVANPTAPDIVQRSMRVAGATVDLIASEPGASKSLMSLFTRDYYTYTHCVHVCILGVAMYKHLVSPKDDQLRRFGLGMLLHDTGKSVVDQAVLNKPDRLTEEEFQHMKSHPVLGWELLQEQGVTDDLIRQAVLHHHEKMDGSGYPGGLMGNRMSAAARVAAIVDVYDALTTDRPYRDAMDHDDAIDLMTRKMTPHHLDAEFLQAFEKVSRRFPEKLDAADLEPTAQSA